MRKVSVVMQADRNRRMLSWGPLSVDNEGNGSDEREQEILFYGSQ